MSAKWRQLLLDLLVIIWYLRHPGPVTYPSSSKGHKPKEGNYHSDLHPEDGVVERTGPEEPFEGRPYIRYRFAGLELPLANQIGW